MQIEHLAVDSLYPYINNARTHDDAQVAQIAASVREFGWTNPLLIDEDHGIIAGHGRLAAARKLGMDTVPAIRLEGLSDAQKKAYVLADNQLALNAGWDEQLLRLELDELVALDFDIDLIGFDDDFFDDLNSDQGEADDENPYSMSIDAPTYEPTNDKPPIDELIDYSKTGELIANIRDADIPKEEKNLLMLAAERHTIFNFGKIADYYAHSSPEVQALMEQSAMVIIDYQQAIENGFVQVSTTINSLAASDHE